MTYIDVYEPPAAVLPCFICGATTPGEGWTGCLCGNEDDCGRCGGQHDPELPCVAMSADAEDRLCVDRRA